VLQPKRVDKPKEQPVKTLEEDAGFSWKNFMAWLLLILLLLALAAFLFLLWMRTIAIYAEAEDGKMKYIGRQWIRKREERYEVVFPECLLEKCVTTHFMFKPGRLFVKLHQIKEICILFPEDICMTKQVDKTMEVCLL